MKSVKLHRVNFYEPKPKAIRCFSYDESTSHLAVSRADNSIEIWDVKETPYQETIIPGDASLSVESIALCEGRLFSGGLRGYILEYDIPALLPKSQILTMAGRPIWCMSFNEAKTHLAIGNDDGYVILFEISEGLQFEKRLDKQEGSILCLDWHKDGHIIATGSIDAIRTWDVQTGHVINRIMLSRVSKNVPTVVWCIALMSDMTIVSGDSSGKTYFWNGHTGTLISSSESKKGDILSLTVSKNEELIYSSGVEPTIISYMQSHSNGLWMKSIQRLVHTHDIRALQLVGDLLFSGGDDCNLVCTKYPPKTVLTFYPFCQKTYATVAAEASCILLQYPHSVEVWKIGQMSPFHLLRIKPKSNEVIISSSISTNGKFLAYSTRYQIRLFSLYQDPEVENSLSMSKVEVSTDIPPSSILRFSKDSTRLFGYGESKIFIVKCDTTFSNIELIITEETESTSHIHLMELSADGSYLACGSHDGNVIIYSLKSVKVLCKLPLYKCQPTAMTFSPSSENLIVVYSDRKVVEYSIEKQAYTSWSKQEMHQQFKEASLYPIVSMCFCSDRLYLLEENVIYVMDKVDEVAPAKKRIKQSERSETALTENSFQTVKNYQHLSSIHSFKEDVVLVQIPSSSILNCLPPPVWKKLYGT